MEPLDPKRQDDIDTWALLYREGGEPLLRRWSKMMFEAGRNWIDDEPWEYSHGIRLVRALSQEGTSDEEILPLLKLVPVYFWTLILEGKYCSKAIIEHVWYNEHYIFPSGRVVKDSGAAGAFFKQIDLALELYRERPDLAALLSPALRGLYEYAIAKEDHPEDRRFAVRLAW